MKLLLDGHIPFRDAGPNTGKSKMNRYVHTRKIRDDQVATKAFYASALEVVVISIFCKKEELGAPDRIRTCDLCLRRAALYPAELRVPDGFHITIRTRADNGYLAEFFHLRNPVHATATL